mgnify:CR=1 FL=1
MTLKLKAWFHAFRLRTLPLAFSSIVTGSGIAYFNDAERFSTLVLVLCFVTTLLLQVLSNLANDYGDSKKGTDNADRVGPARAIQSGMLSFSEIKRGIIAAALLSFVFGIWLIVEATKTLAITTGLVFFVLGIGAIAAAIKYTMGKNPYGYKGLGDVFVFLFFGWVGVCGSYYLQLHSFDFLLLFPATAIGLWATTVLHLNNMRDRVSDEKAGKITLAVKLGFQNSKLYFYALNIVAAVCMLLFFAHQINAAVLWLLPALGFVPFLISCMKVYKINKPAAFDPLLKINALATFAYSILLVLTLFLKSNFQ